MKVKAVKVNRAHYFLTDPRIVAAILLFTFSLQAQYSANYLLLKTLT